MVLVLILGWLLRGPALLMYISVCRKVSNPWHRNCRAPPPNLLLILTFSNLQRFRIRKINQTGKYEAIQI